MASGGTEPNEVTTDKSESDFEFSQSEEESDSENDTDGDGKNDGAGRKKLKQEACKYYNQGKCKNGADCEYLHVCQYYLNGNCKYGSRCKYRHKGNSDSDSEQTQKDEHRRESTEYQWQISEGENWLDINNDWVIEGQYSQPGAKRMTIYNTKFGAICIDFNRMRVRGKDLRVRRLRGKNDKWMWYFRSDSSWTKYGKKDSKGNPSAVTSEEIERNYLKNRKGSHQFTIGLKPYKISFAEMVQVNMTTSTHRRVARRPRFTGPKADAINAPFKKMNISGRLVWQYEGSSGWHEFKQNKIPCEAQYQQNPQGSMTFTIGNSQYKLDFAAMTQTNLTSGKVRNVRRITL